MVLNYTTIGTANWILRGLSLFRSVWEMASLAIVAIVVAWLLRRRAKRKGKVHFIPDYPMSWSGGGGQMEVFISGTATYEGADPLNVVEMYLKGTRLTERLEVTVTPLDSIPWTLDKILLNRYPRKISARLTLIPNIGIAGAVLRRKLVFRDADGREFRVGPLDFAYLAPGAK